MTMFSSFLTKKKIKVPPSLHSLSLHEKICQPCFPTVLALYHLKPYVCFCHLLTVDIFLWWLCVCVRKQFPYLILFSYKNRLNTYNFQV